MLVRAHCLACLPLHSNYFYLAEVVSNMILVLTIHCVRDSTVEVDVADAAGFYPLTVNASVEAPTNTYLVKDVQQNAAQP